MCVIFHVLEFDFLSERGLGRGRESTISKIDPTPEDVLTDSRSTLDEDSTHGAYVFVCSIIPICLFSHAFMEIKKYRHYSLGWTASLKLKIAFCGNKITM